MATLKFKNINKIYDNNVQAVFDFNLEVQDKEFIVFVGPSGCGKSTTLRMVAGLEDITSGELYIDDKLVNDVAPKNRDIAMVFQSYALYPHMTVYDNMAFGLKLKKMPKAEIDKKIKEVSEILGLTDYLNRKPKALSGGQRQRVALGRAIVRNPKVFLMDEPLSNLDAKLRVQMRSEIARIHEQVGATTIYVTHDQTEAMTMASRIVVMKDGYIQQIGTPKDVYNYPNNIFVAGFIGAPAMNFINGTFEKEYFIIEGQDDNANIKIKLTKAQITLLNKYVKEKIISVNKEYEDALVDLSNHHDSLINSLNDKLAKTSNARKNEIIKIQIEEENKKYENDKIRFTKIHEDYLNNVNNIVLGIRPEDIYLDKKSQVETLSEPLDIDCDLSELLGHELIVYGYLGKQKIIINTSALNDIKPHTSNQFSFDTTKMHFFDKDSTNRIK